MSPILVLVAVFTLSIISKGASLDEEEEEDGVSRSPNKGTTLEPEWNEADIVGRLAAPKITGPGKEPEKNSTIHWRVGEPHKVLRCEASGAPMPEIRWFKQEGGYKIISAKENRSAGWSEVVFLKVDFGLEGHYYCVATNSEGVSKRFYHVIVDDDINVMTIVVSVIAAAVFIVLVLILVRLKLKSKRHHEALKHISKEEAKEFQMGDENIINSEDYIGSAQVLIQAQPYDSKYEIPRKNIFVYNHLVLGTGEFGVVVEGAIQHPADNRMIQVAVKTVRPNVDLQYFRALLSEVKVMTFIGRHPHIVNIVGACTKDIRKSEILLAVEYCRKGNLRDFLRKSREEFRNQIQDGVLQPLENLATADLEAQAQTGGICTRDLIRWSCEIAGGMDFLSSKNIIHADLAGRNILLTENLVAKISDFGLSRQLLDYTNYVKKQQCPLPWKWMAIESLKDMHFSVQSDVWSYGVLLWEIFSLGEVPYPGQNWSYEFLNGLVEGKRLNQPTYATAAMYEMMLECWHDDPRSRPKFFKLKERFERILADISSQDYMDLLQSEYQELISPPEELCFTEDGYLVKPSKKSASSKVGSDKLGKVTAERSNNTPGEKSGERNGSSLSTDQDIHLLDSFGRQGKPDG